MKKFAMKTGAIMCISLFGLVACGSGGGGSSKSNTENKPSSSNLNTPSNPSTPSTPSNPNTLNNPSSPSNPSNPGSPSNPSNPSTPNAPTSNVVNHGVALIDKIYGRGNAKKIDITSSNLNSVTIDGRQISLVRPGYDGDFVTIDEGGTTVVDNNKFKYMRFGAYENSDYSSYPDGPPTYAFALGQVTPANDMPTSGQATYKGSSLISLIGGGGYSAVTSLGTSQFNANFGAKKIEGTLMPNLSNIPISLSGSISGSAFSGQKDHVKMSGNFYGPQASELGGVFNGSITHTGSVLYVMGSFGAKKQ